MNRISFLTLVLAWSLPLAEGRTFKDWQPGDAVKYVRDKAPEFKLPSIKGERREMLVPDTLDLAYRAVLGLNVLTENLEPSLDYEQSFWIYFNSNPAVMLRDFSSVCDLKFLESMPLMRIITGSRFNEEVEKRRLAIRLRMAGNDGFLWDPLLGRPWMVPCANDLYLPKDTDVTKLGNQMFVTHLAGRWLGVAALQYELTGDHLWREVGEKQVDAFNKIVCRRDDYAFTPVWVYFRGMKINPKIELPTGVRSIKEEWIIQGLAQFYRATGYKPAKELAGKLIRYFRYHAKYYGPNGEYDMSDHMQHHCHDLGLLAMSEYAVATGDKELLEFTRKGYEHGRKIGNPLIGYFPEAYSGLSTAEACAVGDMVALAVLLSRAGAGDYWDDAERYLRNHFAELQLTDPEWVYRHIKSQGEPKFSSYKIRDQNKRTDIITDRVVERNIGSLAGWASANDWYPNNERAIMHCCTGNCTRAIYHAWKNILDYSNGKLKINLLLNRASQWADILSYIPYEGRVDFRIKKPIESFEIRIPEWVEPGQVTGTIDGKARDLRFDGRYAKFGPISPGQEVVMTFPISERTEDIAVDQKPYRVIIKGNTVVNINPPGKVGPLYQRARYRENQARWHKVQWFAPDKELLW